MSFGIILICHSIWKRIQTHLKEDSAVKQTNKKFLWKYDWNYKLSDKDYWLVKEMPVNKEIPVLEEEVKRRRKLVRERKWFVKD